ncbi:patatin-like phospholipase family protein [Arsukibacterium sp.]|uniref:patatin-like phospholipase family protein n=1 Tax=Arsukibacterium sp. TaxID=1977258 RepID=UPI00299E3921|nr:patatin-like phospholipase family protein [Arsukibacterium sp.]MDX1676811.1 patatin-like phospholipase family protein [Arsukibacterium sp.]
MAHIKQHGLRSDDISVMVGASGGPKWFSLFGLDQYLLADFFAGRTRPLHLLGSSAGAWRFACYAQADPVAASKRFAKAYSTICYPAGADITEVTRISAAIVDEVFQSEQQLTEVLDNPVMKLNLIVAKARGLNRNPQKLAQLTGLTLAAAANLLNRRYLQHFYQRLHFHPEHCQAPFHCHSGLPTRHVPLSRANLRQAVMASGSIPLVLSPVTDIAGAGPGQYYDGGITDYHFDLPFSHHGLVLYPHFYPRLTPGWFDKALKWRRAKPAHLHNVVLLCPSASWIASLPNGKIPDRNDFKLPDAERLTNWRIVLERSHELAAAFASGQYQLEPL